MFKWVQISDGHDNFFTPLRFIFAFMVLIGHGFVITVGGSHGEPQVFYGYTFSYLAVNLFFIASGFLVTKSMLYRGDIAEYSSARMLRIYPALIAHVLFVMFIIGPFVTSLPAAQFFTDPQFWTQPLQVLSFYETNMVLPGAFENNHENLASGTLWTLRYEVLAYIGTAILFALGLLKKKWMLLAQFVVCAVGWMLAQTFGVFEKLPATGQSLLRFGICYGLGAAIYAYRDIIKFNLLGLILITMGTIMTQGTFIFEITVAIMLAYFVFWAAYMKLPKLNGLQKMSDISYGIYIYHWSIMQVIAHVNPEIETLSLIAIATPLTILISAASWRYVEKPMLNSKKSFAEYLRFGRSKPLYNRDSMLVD
jgi:peptidoglycan/LPS O-acetylase OafA/YrhL